LLDIADNFDRAVASFGTESAGGAEAVREGVALIHQSFRGLLRERGVEPIEALGREFDPNEHEAVAQMASEEQPSGFVVEVVQPGYRFGDLILRPARVVIAS
jgi:molecular chaperone GrpE